MGLDPTTCATADELFLDNIPTAGQSVTYCYTITNVGTMPLAWHNVEDTAEGMLMQGVQTSLGVGQSYTLLRTTTLTHAQAVTTTWHAYNEARTGSPSATAADTITAHSHHEVGGGRTDGHYYGKDICLNKKGVACKHPHPCLHPWLPLRHVKYGEDDARDNTRPEQNKKPAAPLRGLIEKQRPQNTQQNTHFVVLIRPYRITF